MNAIPQYDPNLEKMSNDVNELTNEIKQHRTAMLALEDKIARAKLARKEVKSKFDAETERCAQEQCLSLAKALRTKLPRELRDMVYAYACVEEEPIKILPAWWNRPLWNRQSFPCEANCYERQAGIKRCLGQPNSHLLDPAYMGKDIAVEMLHTYYVHNIFNIAVDAEEYSQVMESFLFADIFGLGFRPNNLVRKLLVTIRCDTEYHQSLEQSVFEDEIDLLKRQYWSLSTLVSIRKYDQLQIEFRIETKFSEFDFMSDRYIFNVLEILRQTVYDLKHSGSTVTVTQHNLYNHELRKGDHTHLFNLTSEQWAKEPRHESMTQFVDFLLPPYPFRRPVSNDRPSPRRFRMLFRRRWGGSYLSPLLRPDDAD